MRSAFGIDHGEVSKAASPLTGPQKVKGALNRIGTAHVSIKGVGRAAGRTTRKTGQFLERNPGVTGTALVGGGGYAGYKYLSEKEPRKRK